MTQELTNTQLLLSTYTEAFMAWLTEETFLEYKQKRGFRVRHPETWKQFAELYASVVLELDPETTYVSSDHHFGHKNILKYSDRPFSGTLEMREEMIRRHNATVGPDDTWICVGDFAFLPDGEANEILSRMTGARKILIIGNHDIHKRRLKSLVFDEVYVAALWEQQTSHFEEPLEFFLSHYPYPELQYLPNVFNIHGHEHIAHQMVQTDKHFNVNVEFHDYTPVQLSELLRQAISRRESISDRVFTICE